MSLNLRKQQLPLTAFFTDSGRKSKGRKSNPPTTSKRKRDDVGEEVEEPQPIQKAGKQNNRSSLGARSSTKPAKEKPVAREPITPAVISRRKPSYPNFGRATTSNGNDSDPIDLTDDADEPLMTPFSIAMVKERRPADRLVQEHRKQQLMTPPPSSAIKRTDSQVAKDASQNSRPTLSFSTPGFGLKSKAAAKAKVESQASSSKEPQRQPIDPSRKTGMELPTPGTSVPRAKRPRLHPDAAITTVEPPPDRSTSSAETESPVSSPIVPVSDDDVFASTNIITTPRHRKPIHVSPKSRKPVSKHGFKAPALPIYTHDSGFSTSDESVVATSQTQDLRPYIPTPPRPRASRPIAIPVSPHVARLSHQGPENISSRRPSESHGEDLVGTSQSQEVEMHLPEDWKLNKTYDFVLGRNHLLRTPVKPKSLSQR